MNEFEKQNLERLAGLGFAPAKEMLAKANRPDAVRLAKSIVEFEMIVDENQTIEQVIEAYDLQNYVNKYELQKEIEEQREKTRQDINRKKKNIRLSALISEVEQKIEKKICAASILSTLYAKKNNRVEVSMAIEKNVAYYEALGLMENLRKMVNSDQWEKEMEENRYTGELADRFQNYLRQRYKEFQHENS